MKMERDDARREVRARWREIITEYTSPAKEKANGKTSYICPFCGHGKNGDGLTHNPKGKPGSLKCFGSCQFSGDIIDLISRATGADYNTALKEAAGSIGIEIEPYRASAREDFTERAQETAKTGQEGTFATRGKETPTSHQSGQEAEKTGAGDAREEKTPDYSGYYRECAARITDPAATAYMKGRGISLDTARRYNIGFDPQADPANAPGAIGDAYRLYPTPRIIIPVTPGHYIGRRIDGGADHKKLNNAGSGNNTGIFNAQALQTAGKEGRPVFVTEGAFDALAILEAGGEAVALNSVSNAGKLLKDLEAWKAAGPVILCLDGDDAGQKAQRELAAGLEAQGIPFITADINGGHKDPNEALTADRERFTEDLQRAMEQAEAEANRDDLTEFWEKIQTEAYKPYSTGLHFFDDLLGGGPIKQTVLLIMAAPGAGKTTLCQQIAEEMAKRKKSVVFLNLEMSREQMLAKAISAKMAQEGKGTMSATDVLQGYRWTQEQRETVRKTLEEYRRDIYPYMKYNPAGMTGDLDQLTEYLEKKGQEAKEAGQQAPAVVLDYLHLVSTSKGLDLQELIKQTVAEIKHYCIKYDSIGIIISATNRLSNTTGRITLDSGRDSSNIEYGGDALISLNMWEVDQGKVKPNEPDKIAELLSQPCRHMILRVLKARLYQPGKEARIYFHAATNRFFGEYEFIPAGITGDLIPFEEPAEQEKEGPAAGTSKRRTL
jgi:DNA primase